MEGSNWRKHFKISSSFQYIRDNQPSYLLILFINYNNTITKEFFMLPNNNLKYIEDDKLDQNIIDIGS